METENSAYFMTWGRSLMMLFWLLFLIVIGFLVIKWLPEKRPWSKKKESPLEGLKRRYENEEISLEEFERLKRELPPARPA